MYMYSNFTFMTNSMINIPKNMASVDVKSIGMEVRSEVVSMAMVTQLRRMVAMTRPLKNVVCRGEWMHLATRKLNNYYMYI